MKDALDNPAGTQYVLGFIFNGDMSRVLLTLKKRPAIHQGKWNGVGGKVVGTENIASTMKRECLEETGFRIPEVSWIKMCSIVYPKTNTSVHCFYARFGHVESPTQMKDEKLQVFDVIDVMEGYVSNTSMTVPHVRWLINHAIEHNHEKDEFYLCA